MIFPRWLAFGLLYHFVKTDQVARNRGVGGTCMFFILLYITAVLGTVVISAIDGHLRNLGSYLQNQLQPNNGNISDKSPKPHLFSVSQAATSASIPAPNLLESTSTTPATVTWPPTFNDSKHIGSSVVSSLEFRRCGVCPVANLKGCCIPYVRRKLVWFLDEEDGVSSDVKNAIRSGLYGRLNSREIAIIPTVILRRLNSFAVKQISTSQVKAVLLKFPSDFVTMANLLRNLRSDYFDVFLTHLKLEIERGDPSVSSLGYQAHSVIARTASAQWGPYDKWDGPQLSVFSFWVPHLPCHTFYKFQERQLMSRVLPASVIGQNRLSECSKRALFTRMYQARQLLDVHTWSPDRTVTFAQLLAGGPPQILRTLPMNTLQNTEVLSILTELSLSRSQVEAILDPLRGSSLSSDMILAMRGADGDGCLLNFMPHHILSRSVQPSVFLDTKVASALKEVYCTSDPNRAFRTGYQIYWWYRRRRDPQHWSRRDIQRLGCLVRYLAPLDLAKLNLLEMAKDIENTFTVAFRNGDYSGIQAKILLNYGTQLLHLGSGSWTKERFAAIPSSIIPGIPIHKISEFSWEEASSREVIDQFRRAASGNLGLNKAQIAALLNKLDSVPGGGLRMVVRNTDIAGSAEIMKYISYQTMNSWRLSDFRAADPPKLSTSQARFWLKKLTESGNITINARNIEQRMFAFAHGIDCEFSERISLEDFVDVIGSLRKVLPDHQFSPEIARCLKFRLIQFLNSLDDNRYPNSDSGIGNKYWPSLVDLIGPEINQQFNGLELRGMSDESCIEVVSSATDTSGSRMFQKRIRPRGRRESFVRSALSCIHRNFPSEYKIGLGDAVVLKYALSDLPGDVYLRIPDEVFFKNIHYIQGGCLTESQRRGIRSKIISTFGNPSRWGHSTVGAMGCLLYELDTYLLEQIPDAALADNIQLLGTCWDERKLSNREFLSQCIQELGEREGINLKYRINSLNRSPHPGRIRSTDSSPFRPPEFGHFSKFEEIDKEYTNYSDLRMMREPPLRVYDYTLPGLNMTCDWFKAAGSHVTSLASETFSQPGNMSDNEFVRCIPEFGQFPLWPQETRDIIWRRLVGHIGFPSPREMETMGSLLLSLDGSELDRLDFGVPGGLDLLYSFGSLEGWSDTQLRKLVNRFRLTVTPVMENIDSVQIAALGYIICGFAEEEISRIDATVFRMSAVAIGELRSCKTEVLGALAKLATKNDAFGNVAYWDGSTIETLGIILAGLSFHSLQRLHPPSLNGLKCNAVQEMSPHQFQSFNPEQLDHFSLDAAMCVKKHHVRLLSEAQRYAVWAAGSDAPRISASASLSVNISVVTVVLLLLTCAVGSLQADLLCN